MERIYPEAVKTPRLVAIDMDGTLLGSNGRVSDRNLRALSDAQTAGIEVVIATGRRHCYAMRVLRELELSSTNALVSSNGTVIRTIGSELIHRHHMLPSTAHWLCSCLAAFRDSMVITFDQVGIDGEDRRGSLVVQEMDGLHASIGRWMEINEPYIARVDPLELALENEPPIQMMLCGTLQRMAAAETLLRLDPRVHPGDDTPSSSGVEVTLHRTVYPDRDLCLLDILPAEVSKASALRHLAAQRGFGMEEVLAIGDNWNDLPMLEGAGTAVLMGNAPEDLKDVAVQRGWTIGLINDQDGVAEALEAMLKRAYNEALTA